MVAIVPATAAHIACWAELRAALWPDEDLEMHRREIERNLERPSDATAFLAIDGAGAAVGLAEASLRHDYVNGCETSPVLFLEGIHVQEDWRRRGLGRQLCAAVEAWGRMRGCREFASDAPIDNAASRRFHALLGFEETEQVVYFRRLLGD